MSFGFPPFLTVVTSHILTYRLSFKTWHSKHLNSNSETSTTRVASQTLQSNFGFHPKIFIPKKNKTKQNITVIIFVNLLFVIFQAKK